MTDKGSVCVCPKGSLLQDNGDGCTGMTFTKNNNRIMISIIIEAMISISMFVTVKTSCLQTFL